MSDGHVVQVNVSAGGVPKLPVAEARVTRAGVDGDRQRAETVHGGPYRAVSLLGVEAIERLAAEGHPIAPGTTGENLTLAGFDVSLLAIGTRLHVGEDVVLELTGPANPCRTIRASFTGGRFGRLSPQAHPADGRMYARVLAEGVARPGDAVRLEPPTDDAAERHAIASRLEDAERASTVAVWDAARASGTAIEVIDDGELAIAAAPDLPSPLFNLGLGFADLPHLVPRAVEHFRRHRATGWIWTDVPPWAEATPAARSVYAAAAPATVSAHADDDGSTVVVRELARDEVGPWAPAAAEAADLDPVTARAWIAMEHHLARVARAYRFVAEVDGVVVGTGLLHLRRGVGWLRTGTVLPAFRGRGIQRALIVARTAAAASRGADLVGAAAPADSVSAVNLERLGFRVVATRTCYRVDA
jgi:MOSC domain-containing protein YiiM